MTIITGSHALVEDDIVWRVPAGADAYLGPIVLIENGSGDTPVDLTGYSAGLQVRRKYGGAEVLASLHSDDGTVTIDGLDGSILFHLPAEQSREWSPRWVEAVFDAELYAPGGQVIRLCNGSLDIRPNVTVEEA